MAALVAMGCVSNGHNADVERSPSASRPLVFAAIAAGDLEIFVEGGSFGDARQLSDNPGNDMHPDWSPRGDRILYTSTRGGNTDLFEVGVEGGDERRLTTGPEFDGYGAYSPDGTMIAFASAASAGGAQLTVVNAVTLETVARAEGFGEITAPLWSPDGKRLAYARPNDKDGRKSHIVIYDLASGVETKVSSGDGVDSSPSWSADATRISFTSFRDSRSRIYVVGADGQGETQLTDTNLQDVSPAFANDHLVAFACTDPSTGFKNVCLVDVVSRERRVLAESQREIVELSVDAVADAVIWVAADAAGYAAFQTNIADGSTQPLLTKRKVLINVSYAPTRTAVAGAERSDRQSKGETNGS